jgi:hypothetical protein
LNDSCDRVALTVLARGERACCMLAVALVVECA